MKTWYWALYPIHYVLFISKVLEHNEVDLINEVFTIMLSSNKINKSELHHIGLKNKEMNSPLRMVFQRWS